MTAATSVPAGLRIEVRSRIATVRPDSHPISLTGRTERVLLAVEQGPPGPKGDTGPAGPAFTGTAWFYGEGEPDTVVGSKPGDYYVDTITGVVYELGGNH